MKGFFDGVRRHIGNMDAEHLREQYRRLSDEVNSLDALFGTMAQGLIVVDGRGEVSKSNPAARELLGQPRAVRARPLDAHRRASGRVADRVGERGVPLRRRRELLREGHPAALVQHAEPVRVDVRVHAGHNLAPELLVLQPDPVSHLVLRSDRSTNECRPRKLETVHRWER